MAIIASAKRMHLAGGRESFPRTAQRVAIFATGRLSRRNVSDGGLRATDGAVHGNSGTLCDQIILLEAASRRMSCRLGAAR